jgi:Fe-S oxidoreductase
MEHKLRRYAANQPAPFSFGTYFGDALLLTDMQAPRKEMPWVRAKANGERTANIVLYLGCNVHKTMNIVRALTDLMTAMGLEFGIVGGPSSCCGVIHGREGQPEKSSAITRSTWKEFESFKPRTVVIFCPSSRFHFENRKKDILEGDFELVHVSEFLMRNLDRLPVLKPVASRALLHSHAGDHWRDSEAACAAAVLRAIPGLEIVETKCPHHFGRHCTTTNKKTIGPTEWDQELHRQFGEARSVGASRVVAISHECQRLMYEFEPSYGMRVDNFVSLLAESAGIVHDDVYRRCMASGDVDEIYEILRPNIEVNNVKEAAAKDVIRRYFVLGDLPEDLET